MRGLDEVTAGGLPAGRPTLICGGPGAGKTLFAITFLARGATVYGESGVLMTFEQTPDELAQDVASLGFDLNRLVAERQLAIDHVRLERHEIEETGEYDLEALFVRLNHAIESVGAKRVVLDTVETLFAGFSNASVLRAELQRLFRWLRDKGITAVVTAERGEGALTRHGLEEYVSDAVILLDHRVHDQVSTRRLRIVKYRGSHHGTNEYPFLIDHDGISVLPVTSVGLEHDVSTDRVSAGVPFMDAMLGGRGYYRGSTVLVSGQAGTGKTSIAASFVNAACARGEKCLYFLFEESPPQLIRNMRSIGIDLKPWVERGLLRFHADRPSRFGLETHLATMYRAVRELQPSVTVVDPITNLVTVGTPTDVRAMLTRVIDHLKSEGVTGLFTSLSPNETGPHQTDIAISSLMDTWVLLSMSTDQRERRRSICVLKSRGMAHSNRLEEFVLTDDGVRVVAAREAKGGAHA